MIVNALIILMLARFLDETLEAGKFQLRDGIVPVCRIPESGGSAAAPARSTVIKDRVAIAEPRRRHRMWPRGLRK
jgi:hypothetical protein